MPVPKVARLSKKYARRRPFDNRSGKLSTHGALLIRASRIGGAGNKNVSDACPNSRLWSLIRMTSVADKQTWILGPILGN